MRILLDQGTPAPLRRSLAEHQVETAYERGWSTLRNGELLAKAEDEGFEVFVTTDSKLKYQQNLNSRGIAVVVLSTTSWPRIRLVTDLVAEAVTRAFPNAYLEVEIP